jgi:uncharacterized caspase-like protein
MLAGCAAQSGSGGNAALADHSDLKTDAGTTSSKADGRFVALVIGNQHYRRVPVLRNTQADARLIASVLQRAGFGLVYDKVFVDLNRTELELAFRALAREARSCDGAVVYYAGHGVQVGGRNYLVPVDIQSARFGSLDADMFRIDVGLQMLSAADPRFGLALFDACRENPFVAENIGGIERGLAQLRPPQRIAVGFSSQPGAAALDGAGVNGPYAQALSQNFSTSPTIESLLARASLAVWRSTGGQERPWSAIATDLRGVTLRRAEVSI